MLRPGRPSSRRTAGRLQIASRGGARGLVAAMMMTGFRQLTTNLGLLEQTPPEAMMQHGAPRRFRRLSRKKQAAVTEVAHWLYGAGGGVAYGLLPRAVRRRRWAGSAYGLAVWLGFELVLAPFLPEPHPQGRVVGRLTLVVDHALYGVVVSDWFAPEPEVAQARSGRS